MEYWERPQQLADRCAVCAWGSPMYRKTLTSDSLSKHGFFWAKEIHHPLYLGALRDGRALVGQVGRGERRKVGVHCAPWVRVWLSVCKAVERQRREGGGRGAGLGLTGYRQPGTLIEEVI